MAPAWRKIRARLGKYLLVPLALALLVEALFRGGLLSPLELRLQDFWVQWQGRRVEPAHVVIVAIDDGTLAAYPDDPMVFWTDRLAVAIGRLREHGARVIGIDLLLSISPERWLGRFGGELQKAARDHDRRFREEIHRGDVVLVATRTGEGRDEADYLLPSPDYLLALPDFDIPGHIGLADVLDEKDGVLRSFVLSPVASALGVSPPDGVPRLSFPALMALKAGGQPIAAGPWQLAGQSLDEGQAARPIAYVGPPGSVPRIPLKDILSDTPLPPAQAAWLRDRVVLIGGTAAGMNDEHFTPYATRLFAGRGGLMAGVEVQANVVETLLSGAQLQALPAGWRVAGLWVLAVSGVVALSVVPAWAGSLLLAGAAPLLVGGGALAFRHGLVLPAAALFVVLLLGWFVVLGWRLTGEERERARVRKMFGRYVSDKVVEALLDSGQAPQLGGQALEVTVMFSDIRNFTTISERLAADEVVEMLNAYFARACVPLLAEGGSIDKFIGDAVMVEFGSPLPQPDHALRAVRAAVALAAVAEEFGGWMNTRFAGRDLPNFAVGIGLHSGKAVIGNIGSPARMEFTAIGDTVNLASRLEGVTKQMACTILASEATIRLAGEGVACGRSDMVTVKGREAPVRVFEVLGVAEGEKAS